MSSTAPARQARESGSPVRVLFVDTDDSSIDDARAVFEDEFGIEVTAASGSVDDSRSLESVDCVVEAARSVASNDLEFLRAVRQSAVDLPYLVFSADESVDFDDEAMAAGATDFLSTADDAGYRWLASTILAAVASRRAGDDAAPGDADGAEPGGSCLLNASLRFVAVSAAYAAGHGSDVGELLEESWATVFPADETTRLAEIAARARADGSATEDSTALGADGTTVPVSLSVGRLAPDRFVCTVVGRPERGDSAPRSPLPDHHLPDDGGLRDPGEPDDRADSLDSDAGLERADVVDLGDSAAFERRLRRLESLFRSTSGPESPRSQAVCDAVVDAIEHGTPVGVYLYDESTDALRRRAATDHFANSAPSLRFEDEPTPAWRAFVEGEPVLVAELLPHPASSVRDPRRARGVVVPVGAHGVLVVGAAEGDRSIGSAEFALAGLAGAIAGTVLDRIDDERRMERCRDRLEARTVEAEGVTDTNDLLRGVGRSIGAARTRSDLETRVCERIVSHEGYVFARIADYDDVNEAIRDRTRAGTGKGYVETLETDGDALVDQREPMASAIRTIEPQASRHLVTEPVGDRWRRDAIVRGYRAALGVPLVFRERTYGGLAVYSDRPDAFDDRERELFAEIGAWVAHAIHAIETKSALVGPVGVELEFRVRDREIEFVEWARETGSPFEFETLLAGPDGSIRGFFSVEGAPVERVLDLTSRSPAVTETRLVTDRGDGHLFESTFTGDSVLARLLDYGVVPERISASESGGRLVAVVPAGVSVRQFVEDVTRFYPDSTLVRRQERESVGLTRTEFRSELAAALTPKQFEALETAFSSGYFEVPRETTGEEVADIIGITQPTFNNHLRVAQRKLVSALFDDRTGPAD